MARTSTRKATDEKPLPDEDDVDSVDLGTEVALRVMQALIRNGVEPTHAATVCWEGAPHAFLQSRAEWCAAMEELYVG